MLQGLSSLYTFKSLDKALDRFQIFVNQADCDGSLAYGRSHSPHRALAHIAGREHTWQAGLQQVRIAAQRPVFWPLISLE